MKKVKLFELAKRKGIPTSEAIKKLKGRGYPKATAITYVQPDALDDAPPPSAETAPPSRPRPSVMPTAAKVAHIFSAPSAGGASTAAAAAQSQPEKQHQPATGPKSASAREKPRPKTARPAAARPAPGPTKEEKEKQEKEKKEAAKKSPGSSIPGWMGLVASIAALLLLGALYMQLNSERANVAQLKEELSRVSSGVSGNAGRIVTLEENVAALPGEIARVQDAGMVSRLRSQGGTLAVLANGLNAPLKERVLQLSDKLSRF